MLKHYSMFEHFSLLIHADLASALSTDLTLKSNLCWDSHNCE